ncbi:AMP-binding protein [Megasphaera stantonii]|uniref:AMP-binding protein n=1 Tax=Megasphaera stantonii TaxID=2144175 RepID=UPI0023EFA096|nr:AMP-binding protein [Megasphaera stantonii]
MDYLSLIKEQDAEKTALVTETCQYTYGQLARRAQALRDAVGGERACRWIYADTIAEQLIQFLAYAGTNWVPVIAPQTRYGRHDCSQVPPEAACMGVMTSGSSGRPKLWWRTYDSWASFFSAQNGIFGVDETTVMLCQGSLAFTGNLNMYLGVFSAGGTVIGADGFHPKQWLTMIETYRVNALYMIPAKLFLLMKQMKTSGCAADTVTHMISGSQALGKRQAGQLKQVFPMAEIVLYYGSSELNYITYIRDEDMTDDDTLVGRPFAGVHIAVQEDTQEITVSTAGHVLGLSMPYATHDRGYIDDGLLHYLGRSDDICRVNGVSISAYKVERALRECIPDAEGAVVVLRRPHRDELIAYISSSDVWKQDKMRCIAALRRRLLPQEVPDRFIETAHLPKNESGKIDKGRLLSMTSSL